MWKQEDEQSMTCELGSWNEAEWKCGGANGDILSGNIVYEAGAGTNTQYYGNETSTEYLLS